MLKHLPNGLTVSRLLLAFPLGLLILRENYHWALAIGFLAGLTDLLDGYFARRLGANSRFGAALDPIADKVLITVTFLCLAKAGLIPWYLAIAVIARDLIIVSGAACYHWMIGPFELAATGLSKSNMFIQIAFCVLVLLSQVVTALPDELVAIGAMAVLTIAAASGLDYVWSWTKRALSSQYTSPKTP